MNALIIEPSRLYQEIFSHVLTDCAFNVTWAKNGKQAIEAAQNAQFNVICMSMYLPDINAPQLCMRFRAMDNTLHTPIVMITAQEDKNAFQNALVAGATEVFHKNELSQFSIYLEHLQSRHQNRADIHGNILYIEDQLSVAAPTIQLLRDAGYTVTHMSNAGDALAIFKQQTFDLVLTDLILEGNKSGQEMIREILEMPSRYSEIPILAMSGLNDARRRVELLHAGVSDYIQKPVLNEELLARVRNLIKMRHLLDKVEKQREQMLELAMIDQLTHLYNRHYLMDIGPRKIAEAVRHRFALSLLVIDVDHFKKVNDTFGHSMGDTVLEEIAHVLNQSCRTEDTAARFGGEEFVLILTHCNEADAISKGEVIRQQIAELTFDGFSVTASIGIVCLQHGCSCDFKSLFEQADAALYKAKENGRNRIELANCNLKWKNS